MCSLLNQRPNWAHVAPTTVPKDWFFHASFERGAARGSSTGDQVVACGVEIDANTGHTSVF
jgi:hypothetical protein